MVSIRTLSRPYAKAAYEVAKQEKKLDHWMQFFHFISKLIKVNRVQQIVKNETITADKVISFFSSFCKKQDISKKQLNFLKLLVYRRRLILISQIAVLFQETMDDEKNILNVKLYVAYMIDKKQSSDITKFLSKRWNKNIVLNCIVQSELLGGFIASARNRILDASVRTQCKQLKLALDN
jgi:F-type H+-transporting ATPase subunit delta